MPRLIKTLQHYPISRDGDSGISLTLNKITKILNLGCKNISKFVEMFGEFYGICACANTHHITVNLTRGWRYTEPVLLRL